MAKNACKNANVIAKFPEGVKRFADTFVIMQEKRHLADYAPNSGLCKSEVVQDILDAEVAIRRLSNAPALDRRAFAAFVLFKNRDPAQ